MTLSAQALKPEINLHDERLPAEDRQYLAGLGQELARELANHDWGEVKYNYEFPVQVDIIPDGAGGRSATYRSYSAGVMAASKAGMQLRDTRWNFKINRDIPLHVGQPYDTFTGMVEFCVLMCYGLENDLLEPAGGGSYYEKALAVAQSAQFESQYSDGWDLRRDFARDMGQDPAYQTIRKAAFYAKAGNWYLENGKLEEADKYLEEAARLMLAGSPKLVDLKREDHIVRFVDMEQFVANLEKMSKFDLIDRLARWDTAREELYK